MSPSPRSFVLDVSVFVADARPSEPGHADALRLLRALADRGERLLLPMIALPEIASAISRAVRDSVLAQSTATMYRNWPGAELVPLDESLGDRAARLASEQKLRGCDAVYVALAQERDAVLVTLDIEQRDRSPAGVTARSPQEALQDLTRRHS